MDHPYEWKRLCERSKDLLHDDSYPRDLAIEDCERAARGLLLIANQMRGVACAKCKGAGKYIQQWGDAAAFKYDICRECGGSGEATK